MKILVTGCAGFIGFHLSDYLLKQNHEVVGIDNINQYYDISLKKTRIPLDFSRYCTIIYTKEDTNGYECFRNG